MSEILVLIDHADGAVKEPTYKLLKIAKRLGEPSAVFIGAADKADAALEDLHTVLPWPPPRSPSARADDVWIEVWS